MTETTKLHLFKTRMPNGSMQYIFGSEPIKGRVANFVRGMYATKDPIEVDELKKEVSLNHPHIYVEPGLEVVDEDFLNPIEAIKRQAREEMLKELLSKGVDLKDFGTYDHKKFKPTSTTEVSALTQTISNSGQPPSVQQRLASIAVKK